MSFRDPKRIIEEGDTVILYVSVKSIHAIEVHPEIKNKKGEVIENVFQTNYGALKVKNLIGQEYGSKVELSKGYAHVFQPNPEFWTQTLPHRTQIIYTPDISMILFQLEIKPGSVVVESGTGSGSLSHYFLRAIKPFGHLHTFDFHEQRVQQATDEFKNHGLGDFVTVYHRDVYQNGFTDELNGLADAVFLDLPQPELAVPHAKRVLKQTGGRICSFSPCIEQSQRCCELLASLGFIEIESMELLQTEEIVRQRNLPILDFDFVKTPKSTEEQNEKSVEDNKKDKKIKDVKRFLTSLPPESVPGHTGYLTFATLPPQFDEGR